MQLGFVHEPERPLTGFFKPTTDALSTRDSDREVDIGFGLIPRKRPFPVLCHEPGTVRTERVIARHDSQADSATHGASLDVFLVSLRGSSREEVLGVGFGHFVTAHDVLL